MGYPWSGYLWYNAICATRCTDNMHGISRFNGIFYLGRRRNYQTSSIPSRSAPMRFLFERKNKTMPSPYEYEVIIAWHFEFDIKIKQFLLFFQNIWLCIERVVWDKRYFLFFYWRFQFSVTNFYIYFHTGGLSCVLKEFENKKRLFFP